jgi:hypothetical protein
MKHTFKAQSARIAEEFFTSDKFMNELRNEIPARDSYNHVQLTGAFGAGLGTRVNAKRDMPLIQEAFVKIKAEHPELNHARLDRGNYIILDTQPNTFIRRRTARAPAGW